MNTTSNFPEVHAQTMAAPRLDEAAIHRLVHGFYAKVRQDALLGPVFDSRIADWDEHLERMCRFWSSVATMSGTYHGNPMAKHVALPVDAAHFDRWLELFEATAVETCVPDAADLFHRARATHRPQLRARHRGPCRRPAGPGATLPSPPRLSRPARRAVMTMPANDLFARQATVGEIAAALPGATAVFRRFGMDFCCKGNVALENSARQRGVDVAEVERALSALDGAIDGEAAPTATPALIDHIVARYHEIHRRELPELVRLARQVEKVHAGKAGVPTRPRRLAGEDGGRSSISTCARKS